MRVFISRGWNCFFSSISVCSSSSVSSSSSSSFVSLTRVGLLYIFESIFFCNSFSMVFSIGGVGDAVVGTGGGAGFSGIFRVDCSIVLISSKARNRGYSLRLLMRNSAKSSGFSFEKI